jgi:hypothetical protein
VAVVAALVLGLAGPAAAGIISVSDVASEDAVTVEDGTPWPNPNNESFRLYFNGYPSGGGGWQSYPLLKFDLSAYADHVVLGNATLRMYLYESPGSLTVPGRLHEMKVNWTETSVPWDPNPADPQTLPTAGTHYESTILHTTNISTTLGYYSWTVPGSLVQDWIDSPSTNYGLILYQPDNGNNATTKQFRPSEHSNGDFGPYLDFEADAPDPLVVPEPTGLGLIGLALLGLRKRRS